MEFEQGRGHKTNGNRQTTATHIAARAPVWRRTPSARALAFALTPACLPHQAHARASAGALAKDAGTAREAEGDENSQRDPRSITVSATRTPITVAGAPATVTVIDAKQIEEEFITDIRDLARCEPGVTVRRVRGAIDCTYTGEGMID